MSTGESPPSATARFSSPSNTLNTSNNNNNATKKYPGIPKSPMQNSNTIGNRNFLAKNRLLTPKVSAPRPINLPSLRKEHSSGTEIPTSSPSTSHGWGSSSSSPSTSFTQPSEISNKLSSLEQNVVSSPPLKPTEYSVAATTVELTTVESTCKVDSESPAPLNNIAITTPTVRAWAVPTITPTPIQAPSTDFPTAAEAAGKKKPLIYDDKEYLKYASSDPNHTSWDEMVSEDMDDFDVDVVEFDDGTKVQIDGNEELLAVSPSDRFTDDYDRSYPPKQQLFQQNSTNNSGSYKPFRRSEDHGYNTRYNNSVHGNFDNRRHNNNTTEERRSSTHDNNNNNRWLRRDSVDNNNNNNSNNRRSSSSATTTPHHPTTLLQRPRRLSEHSFKSDHSQHSRSEDNNPLQIISEPILSETNQVVVAAQKEVMLTAAERAKKRREEEEAEFEAARIRARQKADVLAEKARLAAAEKEANNPQKETPLITIEKKPDSFKSSKSVEKKDIKRNSISSSTQKSLTPLPDTSKPWNLVVAKKEAPITIENKSTASITATPIKILKNESKLAPAEVTKEAPVIPTVDKYGNPLSKDEQNWELFVSKIKTESVVPTTKSEGSHDWNSFATRLQKSVIDNQAAFNARHKSTPTVAATTIKDIKTEVLDYSQNEDWGNIPSQITSGRGHRGWTRNDEEHGGYRGSRERGTGRRSISNGISNDYWRQSENTKEQPHPVVKILKHKPVVAVEPPKEPGAVVSKKTRLTNLLKESSSPIFPDFIEKLAGKKPANISFMVDTDESDRDITMVDQSVVDTRVEETTFDKQAGEVNDTKKEDEPVVISLQDTEKDVISVPEAVDETEKDIISVQEATEKCLVDETSATSSTASTPPITQFQQNGHIKLDSSSPRRMNGNHNYPVLVYQYPISQQHTEDNNQTNGYKPKVMQQQRPMGVYLMPHQQYLSSNQYMVPYLQAGTGIQPVYYPALPWQQQQQQQQPHYDNNNHSKSSNEWESLAHSNGYQSHRFNNTNYGGRGTPYRKRGGWSSNTNNPRGRGCYANQSRRYPELSSDNSPAVAVPPQEQQQPSSPAETNL